MCRQRDSKALRHLFGFALIGLLLPASASAADLSISLDGSARRGYVGSTLRYAVTVSNNGPEAATDVRVRLSASSRASMIGAAGDGRCGVSGSTAICQLQALDPGAPATFGVFARPTAPGVVRAVAEVSATGMPDQDPANNGVGFFSLVRLVPGPCSNLRLGTAASDLLAGTTGGDAMFGRVGEDTLRGGDGEDCLSGQDGDDTLSGGGGADTVFGDEGADIIDGGSGPDDWATGGSGADRIEGAEDVSAGTGDDRIVAPPDAVVRCGDGEDVVELLGGAFMSGCEQVIEPPAPPDSVSPPPRTFGGEGGVRDRENLRTGKRCRRRYCRRGGIPAWIDRRPPLRLTRLP